MRHKPTESCKICGDVKSPHRNLCEKHYNEYQLNRYHEKPRISKKKKFTYKRLSIPVFFDRDNIITKFLFMNREFA